MFHQNSRAFLGASVAAAALVRGMGLIKPGDTPAPASRLPRAFTTDNFVTYDAMTVDSTGAFLVQELERLDPTLNQPLVSYTWSRDIDIRTDVSMGDEIASWTNSTFAAAGGVTPAGKNWIGKGSNAIPGIQLDIGKVGQPLTLWGMELSYTITELASAQQVGRPIDSAKLDGLQTKHQMDTDEQVYVGDATLGFPGLLNNTTVVAANVPNGASASPLWVNKTPAEILKDVNDLLTAAWAASGWTTVPDQLRLPPAQFAYLNATLISSAGNQSIMSFIAANNLALQTNGRPLNIQPIKWLVGRGSGGTDRMFAYTKSPRFVRFPMVPLQRTPLEFRSIYHLTTYFGRLGVVEFRYPETARYADGI